MAVTATLNVSGVAALRYILVDTTTFYFTNAVDGQRLVLTLQQDGTGSRAVVSGNCPGIMSPGATANTDTTQVLAYDSATNTWNGVPQQLAPGGLALNSYTTSTTISWAKGTYAFTSSSTFTLTITNPTAGPPGAGNDGEIMTFVNLSAKVNAVTMGTTSTVNSASTTVTMAGAIGNGFSLQAWGGKVYVVAASGALTLS
jgi:hypothetical protein